MLPAMENGYPAVREFLDQFVGETRGELFSTKEECAAFYQVDENFRKLQSGEIGDNLMYRYRAIASFHLWDEICTTAMEATRQLLVDHQVDRQIDNFEEFWTDFTTFIRMQHASGHTVGEILSNAQATLRYDIPAWVTQGELNDPSLFRLPIPKEFEFRYTEEGAKEMEAALSTWSTQVKGLSKLVTRIKIDWQVRSCVPAGQAEPELSPAYA